MPQASDILRKWATEKFGSIDTHGPEKFLTDKGWKLSRGWTWKIPQALVTTIPSDDEYKAVMFLLTEWDYGMIEDPRYYTSCPYCGTTHGDAHMDRCQWLTLEFCTICGSSGQPTDSGWVCQNGHGGVETIEVGK